ncbi:MAG: FAD-dependent monooxygenase [Pseudonocardia sp.]|nr:FAD-dependent monooxygenase [Pseudonocardia sp.]
MNTSDTVLVVGAGPVGLTTACQLSRRGTTVRVIDTLEAPTTESRAVSARPQPGNAGRPTRSPAHWSTHETGRTPNDPLRRIGLRTFRITG